MSFACHYPARAGLLRFLGVLQTLPAVRSKADFWCAELSAVVVVAGVYGFASLEVLFDSPVRAKLGTSL